MTARILIVDDHAVVRDGLRMILGAKKDLSVVGNGRERP
jgi:DNA-binding NarL/FixJ family response regulator